MQNAYIILLKKKTRSGLKEWDKKDRHEQIWDNFKTHFCNVQRQLRHTGDLTIKDTINNEDIMSMVSENIYKQLNNIMTTNMENEKEKSDESTQSD